MNVVITSNQFFDLNFSDQPTNVMAGGDKGPDEDNLMQGNVCYKLSILKFLFYTLILNEDDDRVDISRITIKNKLVRNTYNLIRLKYNVYNIKLFFC